MSSITSRQVNTLNSNLNKNNMFSDGSEYNYNMLIMIILVSLVILCLFLFFFSQKFRVNRALSTLDIYIKFQNMGSMKISTLKDYRLCDFYIASSAYSLREKTS
jgi:uncharacterized membrane protein